jgi:[ribosomal protein S5]-alanine N-acetyltransferase
MSPASARPTSSCAGVHDAKRAFDGGEGELSAQVDSSNLVPTFDQTILRTPRLRLRPLQHPDAAALFSIFADARVARYLSKPPWPSIEVAHERIARDIEAMKLGRYACFGIQEESGGRLVGECSLFNFQEQSRRAEVGYTLAFESWGNGYMNEALISLLEFGFSELRLNRVEADVDPRNAASARTLERLGFRKEGHLRERWIVAGEVSDSSLYGLLAGDWRVRAAGGSAGPGGNIVDRRGAERDVK